mgnify:CR=1 FL=1
MSGLLVSELGELEGNGGEGGGEEQVEHRPEPALYEHGFPRLHIGDALHPLDAPDFAAADPQPVDDNPVEPVHDHQKNRRLRMTARNGIMKRLPRRMTSPCSARPRRWASSIYAVG